MQSSESATEWVMERYAITVHKDSGIRNDPNDWALEVGNPRYILDFIAECDGGEFAGGRDFGGVAWG